jgi:hypothetical protein
MKWIVCFSFILCFHFAEASDVISEYAVKLNHQNIDKIADQFEIIAKNQDTFSIYVHKNKNATFLKLAPDATLIAKNIHQNFTAFASEQGYKKFADVEKFLNSIVQKYPKLFTLEKYGMTKENRPLFALKLNTPNQQTVKKEVMITGATHGDELMPVEVLLKLIEDLAINYEANERVTNFLDSKIIYFIPVVSPDSFESRSRYVEGNDPNRSYPWPNGTSNKPVGVIASLINFFHQHDIKASIDFHAYGKLVMYPWGYTRNAPESAADLNVMSNIVDRMSHENNYERGQISTTIYVAKGNSADYYYWKNKTMAIAVEIGDDKIPPISKLDQYVKESREMFFQFLETKI